GFARCACEHRPLGSPRVRGRRAAGDFEAQMLQRVRRARHRL
ncbi:MAG: hypothetical protein AVDCRST_MAG87-1916, partial [uncultured Thermomicrobiales bacterium]